MTITNDLPCEQIAELISRHLDDDLNKEERWQVYHHTTCCPECQTEMEDMAAVEMELSTWSNSFSTETLSPQFNLKIQEAIQPQELKIHSIFKSGYWKQKLRFLPSLRKSHMLPAAAAFAGVVLFLVLWPHLSPNPQQPSPQRFSVAEIPFDQPTKDMVQWNHEQTVPPGKTVTFSVNQGNQKSYLFRMASSRPVQVIVRHEGQNHIVINPEQMMLHGVRYATLKHPEINDAVMIRNDGTSPIQVNAHTEIPQAMRVNFIQNGK
ncbi:MAG: zf-HC2 domain-containing protein [SAR324 cluster bacterium]|nr:zf-HC2 domain-containing protein [SAR324 cluster bacterium]